MAASRQRPKAAIPIPEMPPEPLYEPVVRMSEGHAATCVVKVGDVMPEISLPDLTGNQQRLAGLYGDRLTVVVFWNGQNLFALEQFLRIGRETVDRFSGFGVSVVPVNVGDEQSTVREVAERAHLNIPCLLDTQGDAMRMVATSKLPRTYLLDAAGKVLWLDLEYSLSTQRELRNAVYYFLRQFGAGEPEVPFGDAAAAPKDETVFFGGRTDNKGR